MFLNKKKIKNTVLVASTLLFLNQNLLCEDIIKKPVKQPSKNNIIEVISDTNLQLEIPKPMNVKKIKLDFNEEDNFIKRVYTNKTSYILYGDRIRYKDLSLFFNDFLYYELQEKSKIISHDIQKIKYDNKEYVFFGLLHENSVISYYLLNDMTDDVVWNTINKNLSFPKDAKISANIKSSELIVSSVKSSFDKIFYLPLFDDNKKVEKLENVLPKNLYSFFPIENKLVSNVPRWIHKLDNVYQHQFSTYVNKKNEEIPVLFVIYKDGGTGIFFLPTNGENEMLYYEFKKKVKIDNYYFSKVILDDVDTYKGKNLFYFRIIETDGNIANYGVPEGMF